MKVASEYRNSRTKKIFDKLTLPIKSDSFQNSVLSKAFVYENEKLALVLIGASLFIYWYELLLSPLAPFLANPYLPVILVLLAFYFVPKKGIQIKKLHYWFLVFILFSVVSATLAAYGGLNVQMLLFGLYFFIQFLVVLLIGQGLKSRDFLYKIVGYVSLPAAFYGLYQLVAGVGYRFGYLESAGVRLTGTLTGPNTFGMALFVSLVAVLYFLMKNKKKHDALVALLYLVVIALTFSRTAWLAVLMLVLVMMFFYRRKWLLWSPVLGALLLVPRVYERVAIVFSEKYWFDSAIDGRIWSFNNAVHIWAQHPLFGTGPGSYGGEIAKSFASPVYLLGLQKGYPALYTTDNQYAELLVQTGAVGIIGFGGFVISMVRELLTKEILIKSITIGLLFAWLVMALFSNVLEFNVVTIPFALLIGNGLRDNA